MTDSIVSKIRTTVPVIVGAFLTWLATALGVVVDEDTGAALVLPVTTIVTAVWYAVARALEDRWPNLGWLLGYPAAPSYDSPSAPSASSLTDDSAVTPPSEG